MIKLIFSFSFIFLFAVSGFSQTPDIYQFKADSITGNNKIDFAKFAGKKILIVNIGSRSPDSVQLEQLKELHHQFKSRLVIVAFPSNSFDAEPLNDNQISKYFSGIRKLPFVVASKGSVAGNNMQPLYKWLTDKINNAIMNSRVRDNFQKYLISEKGQLIGVFDKRVLPFDPTLLKAINQ
jgi:glutathione peroxidase